MASLFGKTARVDREESWSVLARVFAPIRLDLAAVQGRLATALRAVGGPAERQIVDFLLESPGKRIRPALALLCAGAAHASHNGSPAWKKAAVDVAAAVELIHTASLIHDDLIDAALVRHHRASVVAKWGTQVAVSLGDHLCAKAFELVAESADPRLFAILGSQLAVMCQGELQQVARRGDFSFCEQRCLAVIEKKTASLFGACCGMGAVAARGEPEVCRALEAFGFHVGIAFQILDDCRDLLSDQDGLGKAPGQDLSVGDVTLPLLYAIRHCGGLGHEPAGQGWRENGGAGLARLREAFRRSQAPQRTAEWVGTYVGRAREELMSIADSDFKTSLQLFAELIAASVSSVLAA
jgi:geranylgeranyl pyrophosphate synthase